MQLFNMNLSNEMDHLLMVNRSLNDGEARIDQEYQTLNAYAHHLRKNIDILKERNRAIEEVTQTVNAMPDIRVDEELCGTTVVHNQ